MELSGDPSGSRKWESYLITVPKVQWFGQFFDEKVPFSEIGIMDNQVNDTPHTERRH